MKTIGRSGAVANIAHRGFSAVYPENTLLSFKRAIDARCDAVELDVQLSADNRLVVFHDFTLERTTDGFGEVCGKTLEELRRLDAGSWRGRRFAGERIPTLQEVLGLTRGRAGVVIEMKARSGKAFESLNERLCVELSGLLSREGTREGCVIASFDHFCLSRMGMLLPGWERALICLALTDMEEAALLGEGILIFRKNADARLVREVHERGLWICSWTVDNRTEMEAFRRMGVDGIATNDPALLGAVLAS